MHVWFLCAVLAQAAVADADAPTVNEVDARRWFNNPPFRLQDTRDVAIVIFDVASTQKNPAWIGRLQRLSRRPNVIAVALTGDSARETEAFIREHRVRFTVGAGSEVARRWRREKPAFIWIDRNTGRTEERQIDALLSVTPEWGEYGAEDFTKLTHAWELDAFVASDAYGRRRADAVGRLAEVLEPERFLQFAQEALASERDPWVRSRLRVYSRAISQGETLSPPPPAPGATLYREFQANSSAVQWETAARFERTMARLSLPELATQFDRSGGDEPNNIVIRRMIVDRLEKVQDRDAAREVLLNWLPTESDALIRLHIVGGLLDLTPVGDHATADVLESHAATEPDDWHVRPMLEYVVQVLRTGEEDTRRFPVPP